MKYTLLAIVTICTLFVACENDKNESTEKSEIVQTFQNKGHELVNEMVQKVGNYRALSEKKDVVYTYTYTTPNGETDISTEKYLFHGELSYGAYSKHERTLADLEGQIEQGYDGVEFWLKHRGELLTDSIQLKRVAFNRPTNFYWFTMFQKLLDPGLNYEFLEEKIIDKNTYDVVKVSFQSQGDKPSDIYQLYINQKTKLVDQFLFTVADFGKIEIPFLMKLQYEEIDGLIIPTKRKYKQSTWEAEVDDKPWIEVTWTDIKFNNDLSKEDFSKK